MKQADQNTMPAGELSLKITALPKDTNGAGDIYAGWLINQMDIAASAFARKVSQGRATTVAMERVEFLSPVSVGDVVSCYTELLDTGRSSMKISVQVYISDSLGNNSSKVTEAIFVYVAINELGGIRALSDS